VIKKNLFVKKNRISSRNQKISATYKNRLKKLWDTITPYGYLLPGLIIFCGFVIYPLFQGLIMSLYDVSILASRNIFTGFDNYYRALFEDPIFWVSIRNTVFYTISNILFEVGLGFILAVLLNIKKEIIGKKFFRTIYLIPYLLPLVGSVVLFQLVLNAKFGLINSILKASGLSFLTRTWLSQMPEALISIFMVSVWIYFGLSVILFSAAIQRIPSEIYDAAKIDGANSFQQVTKIIVPLIKETVTVVIGLTITGSFTQFGLFYLLTGGSPQHQTEIITTWMMTNAFEMDSLGYAAAIAVILLILVLAITIIFISSRGKESYEY